LPQFKQSPEGSAVDTHGTSGKQAQNAIGVASETLSQSDDPPPTPARENKGRTLVDESSPDDPEELSDEELEVSARMSEAMGAHEHAAALRSRIRERAE
jgi:hypothetical protein